MKRDLRLPSKGYDLLRQQVQAKRGSRTNRDPEEGSDRANALAVPAGASAPGAVGPELAGELSAKVETATESLDPADRPAPTEAAREAQGPVAGEAAGGTAGRRSSKPGTPPSLPAEKPAALERITLKFNLKAPAPGLFSFYDRVIETMPPRRALPLLLAKAFEDLEAAVASGARLELKDYDSNEDADRVSTSRTMDRALFQAMRAQLDPFDLMRMTSLGSTIARAALCSYLTKRS